MYPGLNESDCDAALLRQRLLVAECERRQSVAAALGSPGAGPAGFNVVSWLATRARGLRRRLQGSALAPSGAPAQPSTVEFDRAG